MKDRFYQKVREDESGCHLWTGAQNVWGYGRHKVKGVTYSAHRTAWELANGPIPAGLFVLHHCDNRGCVNPAHLYVGTQRDNMRDVSVRNPDRTPKGPSFMRHDNPNISRLEIKMPSARRAALDSFADELGISASDAARLAIADMLARRSLTVTPPAVEHRP